MRFLCLLGSIAISESAEAQPNPWWAGFGNAVVDGPIYTLALDPQRGGLVAGGRFSEAMGRETINVAYWNGTAWYPMDTGKQKGLPGVVYAVEGFYGLVVAGGALDAPFADAVAWDGGGWSSLEGIRGTIHALKEYHGELFAGGVFTLPAVSGEQQLLAKLDGWSWGACDSDPPFEQNQSLVTTMIVYQDQLVVAGPRQVLLWDGSTWTVLPLLAELADGHGIRALASFHGDLVVGGGIRKPVDEIYYIMAWNGERFRPLGNGLNGPVNSLWVEGDSLYAMGDFSMAGGVEAHHIAVWDGMSWHSLGSGLDAPGTSLFSNDGLLYVGGDFQVAGGLQVGRWAIWAGNGWRRPGQGLDGPVSVLYPYGDLVIAGGYFLKAGGVPVNHVAAWDGQGWSALDGGVNGRVTALAEFNGNLIAGGAFTEAGGEPARRVARWDGSRWSPLGNGMDLPVFALLSHDGILYAGGAFTSAGDSPAAHIAGWDGSAWLEVGGGVDDWVTDFTEYQDEVVSVGFFRSAGGVQADRVAIWDGAQWRGLNTGFQIFESVGVAETFVDNLVVGGNFVQVAGTPAGHIACWDGTRWTPMGEGVNGQVLSLQAYGGSLFAGGPFVSNGVGRLIRWDGAWHALDGGSVNGPWTSVMALALSNGSLYAGGTFTYTGSGPSLYVGRWDGLGAFPRGPASLSRFAAQRDGGSVVADWAVTGTFASSRVFYVFRGASEEDRQRVSKAFHGDDGYYFLDETAPTAATSYWLQEVSPTEEVFWHGPRDVPSLLVGVTDLDSFTAERSGDWVVVSWSFSDLSKYSRVFRVYRQQEGADRQLVSGGSFFGTNAYAFVDSMPPMEGAGYWLQESTRSGEVYWHGPRQVPPVESRPPVLVLGQNYPNPFASETSLVFEIPAQGWVTLSVYDLAGHEVARPVEDSLPAGRHEAHWDGADQLGRRVPTGIYIMRLTTQDGARSRKVVRIK